MTFYLSNFSQFFITNNQRFTPRTFQSRFAGSDLVFERTVLGKGGLGRDHVLEVVLLVYDRDFFLVAACFDAADLEGYTLIIVLIIRLKSNRQRERIPLLYRHSQRNPLQIHSNPSPLSNSLASRRCVNLL